MSTIVYGSLTTILIAIVEFFTRTLSSIYVLAVSGVIQPQIWVASFIAIITIALFHVATGRSVVS